MQPRQDHHTIGPGTKVDYCAEILDNLIEGCQIVDFDLRYLYLNNTAVLHVRRKKKNDLLGKRMTEVSPGVEGTPWFAKLECMESRTIGKMAHELVYPDGSTAWFELCFQPVSTGMLIMSLDISNKRQLKETIRENEARFRSYVEHAPLSLLVIDRQGRCLDFNPTALNMLGYDAATLERMKIQDITPEEEHDAMLRDFGALPDEGYVEGEYRLKKCDGTWIWVSLRATRTGDHVMAFCHDNTETKGRNTADASDSVVRHPCGQPRRLGF